MTDIVFPLQESVINNKSHEDVSFKILNQDNLQMTIAEERTFKPFGSESHKRKPNGIVYPTRRIDLGNQQLNQQKHLTKSNGHLDGHVKITTNDNHFSSSHGNLYQISKHKTPDDFAKNLDAKLRKLQVDKGRIDSNHCKKPFITTVKKGIFLEPPDISPPLSKTSRTEEEDLYAVNKNSRKQLYAYVSKPMVLSRSPPQNVHRSRCEAAAYAAGLQYNRESSAEETNNARKHREKRDTAITDTKVKQKRTIKEKDPDLTQASHKIETEDLQKKMARENMARRRALARKKAKIQSSRSKHVITPSQLPRSAKLKAVEIQTENYLHASLVKPPIIDMDTQTDLELLSGMSSCKNESLREAQDEETQIIPGDLFDCEEDIQGALDILVGKTIESALIEILEEEELAALKEQQRRFFEIRAEEQKEAGDLIEKHLVERMIRKNSGEASTLLESYLIQLIPPVLEELKSEFVACEKEDFKNGSILPWLVEELTMELVDILSSGDVLLDMVRDILNTKIEISNAMKEHEEQERSELDNSLDEK